MGFVTHISLPEPKHIWSRVSENGNRYYVSDDGKKFPSITEVLSVNDEGWLGDWVSNVGEERANHISRVASQTGVQIHKACENYLNNLKPFATDKEVKSFLPQIKARFNKLIPALDLIDNVYCQEHMMGSSTLRVAGTTDCIADYDGVLSVIDFKTSKRLKSREDITNYFTQKTAYAIMFYEMYGIKVSQLVTIISVEGVNQPQVFITPVIKHYRDLIETIEKYYEKQS